MVNNDNVWGKSPEEFAEYVNTIRNDAETRFLIEKRVATALFRLPENPPEEVWKEVDDTMAPIEPEELAHLDNYVRMADEHNARYDEVVQTDLLPIMKEYEAELDTKLGAYAKSGEGLEAYFTGIRNTIQREGKKVAASLDFDIDKKTLNGLLEGMSSSLAKMSNLVGGGILAVLRNAACQQRFEQELESWKSIHQDDILVTHNAEINARQELIQGILQKYFNKEKEEPSCGGCGGGSCGSCGGCPKE